MMARDITAALGHLPVSGLNAIALTGILLGWKDRYARNTTYALRSQLKHFLVRAEAIGAPIRLADQIPRVKFPAARRTIASAEDFAAMMGKALPWQQLFLMLARHLGLRMSEAASISESCWNRQTNWVTFTKKGGEQHQMPLTPEIVSLLELAPATGDALTPYIDRLAGRHYTVRTIREQFKNLAKRAGVKEDLVVHDLRRSFCVAMWDGTHDLRTVAQAMGHANMSTTAWYLQHRNPDQLRLLTHELRPLTEMKQ